MTADPTKLTHLKEENTKIATWLAFGLLPLSGFATDIYIPSLPSMAGALHATEAEVQLTLSLFLISYGVTQLFVGSILDSFGRYKLGLYGLFIFAVASFVIASTDNIYIIYLMRIVHGLTVGAVVTAKRAFFVDVYEGEKRKHYLSLFTIIWSAGPIVAPFLGGYFQTAFGWESNFYFLAGLALVFGILEIIFSGETARHFLDFKIRQVATVYGNMLKSFDFVLGIAMLGVAYSMVMVYNMTGPFIIEHYFNRTPIVAGYSSLLVGFAWTVGGAISKSTINKPFFLKMSINQALQLVFGLGMFLSIYWISNLQSMLFFAFLIHIGAGFTFTNYFTYCLGRFPQNAGISSGLTGGFTYIIVSIFSYLVVNIFPAKDETNLSFSYLLLIGLSIIVMMVIYRSRAQNRTT